MKTSSAIGQTPEEIRQDLLFESWRTWPDMTNSSGGNWIAPHMTRDLATANRRAAVYQLLALAHISPNYAFAGRYSLLAQVASRCTDGPLWLRSTKTQDTLAELLYPKMDHVQRQAFDAFTESIQEDGMIQP